MIMVALGIGIQSSALAAKFSSIQLNGHQSSGVIQIADERYEPIYGEVPYQATCSREVFDHTETACDTVMDSVCQGGGEVCETQSDSVCNSQGCVSVPRRVCHTEPQSCTSVPRRECHSYPVNRTEYYSCTRYRTEVIGQRLAKTYQHQIEVVLASPGSIGNSNLNIGLKVSEESLSAELQNSFPSAVLNYRVDTISRNDSIGVVNLSERITVSQGMGREEADSILSTAVSGLELGKNAIRFKVENATRLLDSLKVSIRLVRNPKLWASTTLYDGSLSARSLGWVGQGEDVNAVIPMSKLGVDSIGTTRHDVSVSVSLDLGMVLNSRDFSADLNKRASQSLEKIKPSF